MFHGSKYGLDSVSISGSRNNCDFGNGFYLGENYNQALAFVCEKDNSCVYSFQYDLDNLKIKKFECNLEWMLAICYFRGSLKEYSSNIKIQNIISEVEKADVIIAPIADNKMFYIMSQFTASNLGLQYIFKTEKALQKLIPIEKYYLSNLEKESCIKNLNERSYEIDTKLKLAKREFKNGLYIEEILK